MYFISRDIFDALGVGRVGTPEGVFLFFSPPFSGGSSDPNDPASKVVLPKPLTPGPIGGWFWTPKGPNPVTTRPVVARPSPRPRVHEGIPHRVAHLRECPPRVAPTRVGRAAGLHCSAVPSLSKGKLRQPASPLPPPGWQYLPLPKKLPKKCRGTVQPVNWVLV